MEQKHKPTHQIQFTRINRSPLIEPDLSLNWEAGGIFAPAIVRENGTWKMLYRAYGKDKISRLGYAESSDGIHWTKDKAPRVLPDHSDFERSGVEDPRIVNINGRYLVTYTAYNKKKKYVRTRIRILETTDFCHFKHITPSFQKLWHKNDKDGVLFPEKINGRYYMFHRIEPNIQLCSSRNLKRWTKNKTVLSPTKNDWESYKVGAGAPPIKTPIGWLFFYHGVSQTREYSMGAAILDIHSPAKVLYRLPFHLLSPARSYEEKGVVPNVVFGTSIIEHDDNYYMYYGAGDKVIAAALIDKSSLLEALVQYPVSA